MRTHPARPGRVALLAWLALAAAACAAPRFADTAYRRIAEEDPRRGGYRVRVEAREFRRFGHVFSAARPAPEAVREAVCRGLGGTRFSCVDEDDPAQVADYVIRVGYDVIEEGIRRRRLGLAGAVMGGRNVVGEDDPAGEAGHLLAWKLGVYRPGAGVPVFQSATMRETVQTWRAGVSGWVRRYFSPAKGIEALAAP